MAISRSENKKLAFGWFLVRLCRCRVLVMAPLSFTLSSQNLLLSSSPTTSREFLSQLSTCSGWRWLKLVANGKKYRYCWNSSMKMFALSIKVLGIKLFLTDAKLCFEASCWLKGFKKFKDSRSWHVTGQWYGAAPLCSIFFCSTNAGLMLGQRRRRWHDINPPLGYSNKVNNWYGALYICTMLGRRPDVVQMLCNVLFLLGMDPLCHCCTVDSNYQV